VKKSMQGKAGSLSVAHG